MTERYNILLVEDEEDIRFIVELALRADPRLAFTSFASGEAALEALSTTIQYFDLALLNMRLPGMDGLELKKRLQSLPGMREMAIVFITASAMEGQVMDYEAQGALAVIAKPFDPVELPNMLIELIRTVRC
jgi:two-component system, OmpR family, response regulator